ncbi:MAG: PAS domain-containing protein [Acidobacteria bacterium]|nr:PAS domain-containing protein [Acidobacteriota bacterium]
MKLITTDIKGCVTYVNEVAESLTGWSLKETLGQADDRRKSREAGFNGHLVKPVDYDHLLELLTKLTSGSETRV